MKIGIITIVYAENYGAVLQCYALKHYLQKECNTDIDVVDYHSNADKIGYSIIFNSLFYQCSWINYLKYLLKLPFLIKSTLIHKKVFRAFRRNVLKPQNNTSYDLLIYGSDQIWAYAPLYGGYNNIYWGDEYSAKKKITYSASMGNVSCVDNEFIRKHVNNFDCISVREKELKDFLQDFTKKEISHTIDPTLLLKKEQWSDFCKDGIVKDHEYILVYDLHNNDIIKRLKNIIANEKKLKVIEIYGYPKLHENSDSNSGFTPQDFVSLFKNASYVLTSSFHGTAFSIIFNKNFYVSQSTNKGRVMSLLESLDLQNRFISDISSFEDRDINYLIANEKLEKLRNESANYLNKSIKYEV